MVKGFFLSILDSLRCNVPILTSVANWLKSWEVLFTKKEPCLDRKIMQKSHKLHGVLCSSGISVAIRFQKLLVLPSVSLIIRLSRYIATKNEYFSFIIKSSITIGNQVKRFIILYKKINDFFQKYIFFKELH